jgi:phosphoribosyl-ATP pyrophosphohydrolase/phosphoribosyl-AMP cyclohydrolase
VKPEGPTCHKGTDTCWATENKMNYGFISALKTPFKCEEKMQILKRVMASLFKLGINKIAQKVGEEAVGD